MPIFLGFPLGGVLALLAGGSVDGVVSGVLAGALACAVIGVAMWLMLRGSSRAARRSRRAR